MIIDAHAHVMAFPKLKLRGADATLLSAEQQIAIMDAKGIDMAVILPLAAPGYFETQSIGEVLYICQKYPGRFIPFCNLDPRLERRGDRIATGDFQFFIDQYKALGCKGLGELTARVWWDDPRLMMLFDACEKAGLAVTFHTISPKADGYGLIDEIGFGRLEKALQRFENLRFLGHSTAFWSEISGDVTADTKDTYPSGPVTAGGTVPRLMRRYPNLYGDISARSGLNALTRDPDHAWEFIDEFQDRLVLGLDICLPGQNWQHIEWLQQARDEGHISTEAYEKIVWRNINGVLNLGLQ